MKKFTIILLILGLIVSVNAQNYRNLKVEKAPDYNLSFVDVETSNQQNAPYAKGGVIIGSSQNVYGIMLAGPHQVMYNSEINTVVFVHRALNSGAGDSGELAYDFSTDGGDTWTTESWLSQTMASADAYCRYPSITIFNPAGNTDPASASVVASGPALSDDFGTPYGWGWVFEIDAPISAGSTSNEYYGTADGNNNDFHPYGIEMGSDGTAWTASIDFDVVASEYIGNTYIHKAVWNGSAMVWTHNVLTISPSYMYANDKLLNNWDVAVHPTDPDIVYAVANYLGTGDTREVPSPHVWKTINGGADWTELDALDYTQEPLFSQMDEYIMYEEGELMKPHITDIDCVVDADGTLHVFSTVYSGAPELNYIYGVGDAEQSYRHYMDFTTTDGTDWAMTYINDIECEEADFGAVATHMHAQAGRNESGTDIFYTWSETYADADSLNTAPDMMAAWWNTTDGLKNDSINLTYGTGAQGICYFPQVSPVVIENGDGSFEFPIVIVYDLDYSGGGPTDQANYMYLTDFGTPIGVNEVSKPDVLVYPNPVAEKIFISVNAKVELYNILGARLLTVEGQSDVTTIEMSKYPAGTYLLKVYTDEGIVTKKILKVN